MPISLLFQFEIPSETHSPFFSYLCLVYLEVFPYYFLVIKQKFVRHSYSCIEMCLFYLLGDIIYPHIHHQFQSETWVIWFILPVHLKKNTRATKMSVTNFVQISNESLTFKKEFWPYSSLLNYFKVFICSIKHILNQERNFPQQLNAYWSLDISHLLDTEIYWTYIHTIHRVMYAYLFIGLPYIFLQE